jgi:hypothetical protein
VRDTTPKRPWDEVAPEYDFFKFFSGTGVEKLPEHFVVKDDDAAYELVTDGKKAWRDMWTIDTRNGVWVLRQFSQSRAGQQMRTSILLPRLYLAATVPATPTAPERTRALRKRIVPRQYTRRQLEKMDLPAVRKIAESRGIVLKHRTRKLTYIDHILGETEQPPEVEVSEVTVGYDTSPQIAGAMIKGGWDEAQRIMSLSDLATPEEERDADGDVISDIWAWDIDGQYVDVTLADGTVERLDA